MAGLRGQDPRCPCIVLEDRMQASRLNARQVGGCRPLGFGLRVPEVSGPRSRVEVRASEVQVLSSLSAVLEEALKPQAEYFSTLDLPEALIHWGHPGNMVGHTMSLQSFLCCLMFTCHYNECLYNSHWSGQCLNRFLTQAQINRQSSYLQWEDMELYIRDG